mgnify:CR=1 FL=1
MERQGPEGQGGARYTNSCRIAMQLASASPENQHRIGFVCPSLAAEVATIEIDVLCLVADGYCIYEGLARAITSIEKRDFALTGSARCRRYHPGECGPVVILGCQLDARVGRGVWSTQLACPPGSVGAWAANIRIIIVNVYSSW